jgi:tetratricopeptide (TPR) repeat protein
LGQVLLLSDKPEEAQAEFIKSLEIKQQFLGADDRDLAGTFYNIANAIDGMKNYAEAKIYFEKALDTLNNKIGKFLCLNLYI